MTPACLERTVALYEEICDEVVPVSSPEAAELSKLLENTFRSVNIALVNELAQLTDRLGIDIWEVVDAASSKPFGFMRFEPGPGMGGHCLPVDPFYLAFKARQHNFATEFVELAGKINQSHPLFCVSKIQQALNDHEKPVKGSRILIVGVAYKSGVADLREAPALKIIAALRELGAEIEYHDPHVPALGGLGLESVELDAAVAAADAVAIVTAHDELDYAKLVAGASLVVDFRGVTRSLAADNVVLL
jgi:UDP-N-acetyl-D-glucosamine dehydrogenase